MYIKKKIEPQLKFNRNVPIGQFQTLIGQSNLKKKLFKIAKESFLEF